MPLIVLAEAFVAFRLLYFAIIGDLFTMWALPVLITGLIVGAIGMYLWSLTGWSAPTLDPRGRAADRSGPVAPARASAAGGGRWDLDEIAGELAREVKGVQGVVFREGDSHRMRLMIDPASAIAEYHSNGLSLRKAILIGQWWEVTWRRGRVPRVRHRSSRVGVTEWRGRAIPVWTRLSKTSRESSLATLAKARRSDLRFEITGERLAGVLDEIAVRAGWVPTEEARSGRSAQPAPRLQFDADRETMRPAPEPRVETAADEIAPRFGAVGNDRVSSSWGPERDATGRPIMITPEDIEGDRRLVRILTVVGALVVLGCVIGAGIALLNGLAWWWALGIVGIGLAVAAVIVVPIAVLTWVQARAARKRWDAQNAQNPQNVRRG